MGEFSYDERLCVEFLNKFKDWADSIWGFHVYGTYSRSQAQTDADGQADSQNAQEVADTARFQAVLGKFHAHAEDSLRYRHPRPYNQQLIDTLRLEPAAYLPGASLAEVLPKYGWCLVIDDEALKSIEAAPQPIGLSPPAGMHPSHLAFQAEHAFVKSLSAAYVTMEKPFVLAAKGCNPRWRTEWTGWLKFSPVMLMDVFDQTLSGDIKVYFRGHDKLLEIP